MMFDTAAYFGQPIFSASQFTPYSGLGAVPGQYSHLTSQAIAACLAAQQLAAQQQLAVQLGLLAPTPFGVHGVFGSPLGIPGQPIGGWPHHQQSFLGPQALFGALAGQVGQQPFGQPLGIQGLAGIQPGPYWQPVGPIGAWPVPAQIANQLAAAQLAGTVGRSFQPLQSVPQMNYAS